MLAEIKEQMGNYNAAIRILLKHGDRVNIIKALDCASKHENEILPCYKKERLAHKYAQSLSETINLSDTTSVDHFQSILKYLPASEQVDYLKAVKLYNKACEILQHDQKLVDAYQLCKAQGWFDKGLELAEQGKNADVKMMFLLYKATWEFENHSLAESTTAMLKKNYGMITEKENCCMLVYGMAIHNHTMLCRARLYYIRKNPIAYLEALHIATAAVEYDADKHKWKNIHLDEHEDLVKIILNACTSIYIIKDDIEHAQEMNSPYINYMETFFGIEKDHSGMYLVPESSYPWTNQLLKNNIVMHDLERNKEGLIMVEVDVVLKAVCSRFEEFCKHWIAEDNLKVVQVLCKRLTRFSYHLQVMNCGGHLKESCLLKLDKSMHLQAYLNILSSLFEMQQFGPNINFDIVQTVMNALSPQATCYLQIPAVDASIKDHRPALQLLLCQKLNIELHNKVKGTLNTGDETFNIDEWLELWRILSVTRLGIHEMHKTLDAKTLEITSQIQMMQIQIQTIPQYIYHPKTGTYNHMIMVWLDVCNKMKNKRVYSACTVCVRSFILPIASNPVLWERISVSNFLNIVTVQVVAILMMISICSIHSRNPGNIYIPQSYLNTIQVFLGMVDGEDLFNSCCEDTLRSRKEALQQLKSKLIHLLRLILKAVIGKHNVAFNLLQRATSNEECLKNHEAEHCLVFVLTLLSNMGLDQSISDTELHSLRQQINETIKQCDKPIIRQASEIFSISSTLNNYFSVIKNILEPSRDSLQHLDIRFSPTYKVIYDTKTAKLMEIYQRRLGPLSENLKESKPVDIKFKLRPTAPIFVPSWMKAKVSARESRSQQVIVNNDDAELDDVDIAPFNEDNIPDSTQDTVIEQDYTMITNGICRICACILNLDTKDDDSTSAERAKIFEHCHSDNHQTKRKEYEKYNSEMEVYTLNNSHLFDLANRCHKQYEISRQDHELKKIMAAIAEVSMEFDKEKERVSNSAEWREGITYIGDIGGKIESLIMRGEKELKMSQERKRKLDQEQEEEDRKEDEEQDELDNDDWDEHIPHTDPNGGDSAKKKKRNAKKRKTKRK